LSAELGGTRILNPWEQLNIDGTPATRIAGIGLRIETNALSQLQIVERRLLKTRVVKKEIAVGFVIILADEPKTLIAKRTNSSGRHCWVSLNVDTTSNSRLAKMNRTLCERP
jgi:hypothetical protein